MATIINYWCIHLNLVDLSHNAFVILRGIKLIEYEVCVYHKQSDLSSIIFL